MEEGLIRVPDVTFTTQDQRRIDEYRDACERGTKVTVQTPQYGPMDGYVINMRLHRIDDLRYCDVTVRPTGVPHLPGYRQRFYAQEAREMRHQGHTMLDLYNEATRGQQFTCKFTFIELAPGEQIRQQVEEQMKGKMKRFYVASPNVKPESPTERWAKDTLQEAIAHATKVCETTGQDQYVVQVVRVVRRKAPPVVVETVR